MSARRSSTCPSGVGGWVGESGRESVRAGRGGAAACHQLSREELRLHSGEWEAAGSSEGGRRAQQLP